MRPPGDLTTLRAALTLAVAAATLGACVPTANVAELPDGAASLPCYGNSCIPNMLGAAVTTAPTVDCASAEAGLEFAPFSVLNNENNAGIAQYFYQYVDGTAGLWPTGYEPATIVQPICNGDVGNHVLHESGGPFTGWGGGIGLGLVHLNNMTDNSSTPLCPNAAATCPAEGGYTSSTPCYCPPLVATTENNLDAATAINFAALDVSQWDGISFWARRGPNGQPLMRVLVGDKFTDDDISYLMYIGDPAAKRFCERRGECSCLFQDTSCDWYGKETPGVTADSLLSSTPTADGTVLSTGAYYCGAPGSHPPPASTGGPGTNGNYCGRSLCDQPYPAYPNNGPDAQWGGRACTPFTYRNGTEADVCYNPPGTVDANGAPVPADPLPAEADEQCGDHFTFPVHLTTDWQFFTIPFAQMSQQGWAKQAPYFDLTSVSVVRFTWDAGYVDYYIDDIRFYRLQAGGDRHHPTALIEDGYRLWLRYEPVARPDLLAAYRAAFTDLVFETESPTLSAAREELARGLGGLLGAPPPALPDGHARRRGHRRDAGRLAARRGRRARRLARRRGRTMGS